MSDEKELEARAATYYHKHGQYAPIPRLMVEFTEIELTARSEALALAVEALEDYADPAHWAVWRSYGATKGYAVRYLRGGRPITDGYKVAADALAAIREKTK